MSLRYPMNVNADDNDYILFSAHKYRTNNAYTGQANPGGVSGPKQGQSIALYMPNSTPGISNGQNYGEMSNAGPLGMLKADALSAVVGTVNGMSGNMEQMKTDASATIDSLKNKILSQGGAAAKQGVITAIAGAAGTNATQLMALNQGQIYNPNIELLYEGPKLRGFGFNFNFIPKTPAEANMVNRIIMEFKKWSSPKENGSMFEVPCVWEVTYMSGGSKNKMMNAFKRSSLHNITVQANPSSDMHVAFSDGMPITTSISLQFQEVDVITRQDHLTKSGTLQGY